MPLSADLELQATQLSNVPLPGEEVNAVLGVRSGMDTPTSVTALLITHISLPRESQVGRTGTLVHLRRRACIERLPCRVQAFEES